ncbi:hypothetical protein NQ318_019841 [Aromia moschata]|uniref:Uncharacterized protein n=1 Tax=Aromia moschata TaxID=1265417 RepID=A0AAV8YJT3_9CUCU|nr:hypothetical protein NQ318_019841 [Aromia moschata]
MKVLVFALLVLAAFGNSHAIPSANLDLAEVVTFIFGVVKNVLPETLNSTDIELSIFQKNIEWCTLKINEISLTGSKGIDYTVGRDVVNSSKVDFAANIPDLLLVVDLEVDLIGLPNHTIDLQKIDIFGDVVVNHDFTEVTDFNVLHKIEDDIAVVVKGIVNDEFSRVISAELTNKLLEIFNGIAENGSAAFSEAVKSILNLILQYINS